MIEINAAQKILDNLLLLKDGGYTIPGVVIQNAREKLWAAKGLKQIWRCLSCADWQVELGIKAVVVECPKGHQGVLMWEFSESPETLDTPQLPVHPSLPLPKFHLDL